MIKEEEINIAVIGLGVEERFKIISRFKQYDIPSMIYYKRPLHMQRVFDDLG